MILKTYMITVVLALLGMFLLMKRIISIAKNKLHKNTVKNPKGMGMLYLRVLIMCMIPIFNIIIAIITLGIFTLWSDEKLYNKFDLNKIMDGK